MTAEATATFTAREFNRDVSAAKRAAADGFLPYSAFSVCLFILYFQVWHILLL